RKLKLGRRLGTERRKPGRRRIPPFVRETQISPRLARTKAPGQTSRGLRVSRGAARFRLVVGRPDALLELPDGFDGERDCRTAPAGHVRRVSRLHAGLGDVRKQRTSYAQLLGGKFGVILLKPSVQLLAVGGQAVGRLRLDLRRFGLGRDA